jgi:hypothetical protein
MKLVQYGSKRNHGETTLTSPTSGYLHVDWDEEHQRLCASQDGVQRGNTRHRYRLELTSDDLAKLIETALVEGSKEKATKAHGRAMAAFVREALGKD